MIAIFILLIALGVIGYIALSAACYAFVLTKLWMWFVVPQFALAPLSMGRAYGLELVISMFLIGVAKSAELKQGKEIAAPIVSSFILPWIVLLIGWVVKTYFG